MAKSKTALRKVKVSSGKAEAGGYRAYVDIVKGRVHKLVETKWFKTKAEATRQAAAWKRRYL